MTPNFEKMEHRVQNDMQYICSSIHYLQTCVDKTYSRNPWPVPLLRGHAQPLPASDPPFDTWVPLQLFPRHQLLLKIPNFRMIDLFCVDDKKGKRDFVELSVSFYVLMFSFMYSFMWTSSIWSLGHVFYIVWFGTCFEAGMNLCMDKFLL